MTATFTNPVISGAPGEDHGDPFIIKYLDAFYLYHTGDTAGRRGVSVHRSTDLVHWEFAGYALEAAESGWAWSDLWAPEVVYERGVFYMYISATRRRAAGESVKWQRGEGAEAGRRVGVARARDPLGPFVWDEHPLLDRWSIDAHPFRDDDGTMWLFYNVRTEDEPAWGGLPGTGTVCERLTGAGRVDGSPSIVTFPSQRWEGNAAGDWFWNEGPYVLKRRGVYFQMYSGGNFEGETYAVGSASAHAVTGAWVKRDDNPIFHGGDGIRSPGHHSFVFGPDVATPYAVYHGYVREAEGRKVLLDRLAWCGDLPRILGPTKDPQPKPPPAVFDEAVPHRRAEAWVRGGWVEYAGARFALGRDDVWHQVEVAEVAGRFSLRIGGVLRASRPVAGDVVRDRRFRSDGDIEHVTVASSLDDGALHELPAASSYVWQWGGYGPLELELAVDGTVDLVVGGELTTHEGARGTYRLVQVTHPRGTDEIAVHAGPDGALVTDLAVRARP
ncbi:MAG: glycoside hydrolase family 43 protein [Gaiellaceae bacterium]|jgi:GH43 family beta-xylosidase